MDNLISSLKSFDEKIFFLINGKHSEWSDLIAVGLSSKLFWIPLYIYLLVLLYKKYANKIGSILLFTAALIACSDQLSRLLKNLIQRYRPCHNLKIQNIVHLVDNDCGGLYGFVSSHAANSAAIATFVIILLRKQNKFISPLMITYCLLVSISRIMLGRHYPSDLIGGWLIGITCALIVNFFYSKWVLKNNELQ